MGFTFFFAWILNLRFCLTNTLTTTHIFHFSPQMHSVSKRREAKKKGVRRGTEGSILRVQSLRSATRGLDALPLMSMSAVNTMCNELFTRSLLSMRGPWCAVDEKPIDCGFLSVQFMGTKKPFRKYFHNKSAKFCFLIWKFFLD